MRSPDAVARWAWPIHMPSMRSGIDQHHEYRTLKVKNSPSRELSAATIRPPSSNTRPAPRAGRTRAGHVERALPVRVQFSWKTRQTAANVAPPVGLVGERLHHVHAHDALLHRGDVASSAGHRAARVQDVAVAVGEETITGVMASRDYGEPPVEHVIRASHRRWSGRAGRRRSACNPGRSAPSGRRRCPRHQLAGLMAVVAAEREPQRFA